MLIVLDTNVLFDDPSLEKAHAIAAKDAAEKIGYRLVLPEVVFDEAVHKRQEQSEEARGTLVDTLKQLGRLGIQQGSAVPQKEDIDKSVTDYALRLDQLFPRNIRLPYPSETHRTVATRAMSKQRPFTERDKGYRDTLIWLAVTAYLKESDEPVALISGDSAFRQSKDVNEVHKDLIRDLTHEGIAPTRVTLYKDLGQFVGDFVVPQLEALDEVKAAIQGKTLPSLDNLDDQVGILLNESIYEVSYGSYKEPDYFTVDVIEDVVLEEVVDVHRLPSGKVLARTVWTCEVAPETGPYSTSYLPYDHEGRYISARATIDLVLDPSSYDVIAMDIADFEFNG